MVCTAKLDYIKSLLMRSHHAPKFAAVLWSEINKIIGRHKPCKSSLRSIARLSLDSINNFFRTVAVSHDHQPASSYVVPATTPCSSVSDHFRFQSIQSSEVLSALKGLDTKKSTGPDGIPAFLAEEIAEPLSYIYNHSLNTGTVPLAWKRSNITPVHKGGDSDNPGNFHPISFIPVMAKVLEKFISNQLGLFLENHHLFNDLQGAYRHGRSTDHILLYAVDTITQAFDVGNSVYAAFLDLRKAFDSLDHHVLLSASLIWEFLGQN